MRYRQHAPNSDARYILTTTQGWRRPLEHAIYRLHLNGVEITHSNYDLSPLDDGVIGFDRSQFMPDTDWTIAWRRHN